MLRISDKIYFSSIFVILINCSCKLFNHITVQRSYLSEFLRLTDQIAHALINSNKMKRFILVLLLQNSLFCIYAHTQTTSASVNYVPFEVNDDSSATFRLYAPDAKSVTLGGDLKGVKTERSTDGVWSITTAPRLNPSAYRYFFVVDGMKVNDA